jgi:hypothetical protein
VSGRGATGVGRPARLPDGDYQPVAAMPSTGGQLVVEFVGEDGRRRVFDVAELPLPGWHEAVAAAWHARIGPAGGLRTLASAQGGWANLTRLLRFFANGPQPPTDPARLAKAHLDAFRRHRQATIGVYAWREIRELSMLFQNPPLRELVPVPALDYLRQRTVKTTLAPKPGYSDREFRQIVAAARADVAGIRDRIQAAETLLERYQREPHSLTDDEYRNAEVLADMADSGFVPVPAGGAVQSLQPRRRLAEQLFISRDDLAPMLVLLVATTGWNIETVKELPVEHRILQGRAVELVVTKRRRGPRRWQQTVTWEIGPPGRELHTPGGVYLLLHRLMARSRALTQAAAAYWAVWRNMHRATATERDEHYNPFARLLNQHLQTARWVIRHALTADLPQPAPDARGDAGPTAEPQPLRLDFNRLKTSVDARRTKHTGGHLPSAARTNTIPVLFRNYLRGDPTTIDWAQQVVTDAFTDVEQAAWAAHRQALDGAGGALRVLTGDTAVDDELGAVDGLDTAWSTCTNHDQHPATGKPCRASFLDCFHCGNCLITTGHLPRLLALLDALAARRQQLSERDWWHRYGPTWAAIRIDVLTKFSPAELAHAATTKPADALLDLVEPTWEQP